MYQYKSQSNSLLPDSNLPVSIRWVCANRQCATTITTDDAPPAASVGDRIFVNGVDTGKTVNALAGTTVTASGTLSISDNATLTFFKPNLDMTLIAPDGTEITMQGFGNKKQTGQNFTETYNLSRKTLKHFTTSLQNFTKPYKPIYKTLQLQSKTNSKTLQ